MPAVRNPLPHGLAGEPPQAADGDRPMIAKETLREASPIDVQTLTAADRELLLELAQMALDVVGIVDPTPVSDGISAGLSVSRGDWTGAGISIVAMLPVIGDMAKAGKLPRYRRIVEQITRRAADSRVFRDALEPIARRVAQALDRASALLPRASRVPFDDMIAKLEKAVGGRQLVPMRHLPDWQALALRVLETALRQRDPGRPLALYFGLGKHADDMIPKQYLTLPRLLESTEAGKALLARMSDAKSFSWRMQEEIWMALSERMAQAASRGGEARVTVFVPESYRRRWFSGTEDGYLDGAKNVFSGRYEDEMFHKIERPLIGEVQFIDVSRVETQAGTVIKIGKPWVDDY